MAVAAALTSFISFLIIIYCTFNFKICFTKGCGRGNIKAPALVAEGISYDLTLKIKTKRAVTCL